MYTDQPIFDAMAAATQIDKEPDGVPRIVMSAAKFIEVFNNHRDRALCTSLNVFAQGALPAAQGVPELVEQIKSIADDCREDFNTCPHCGYEDHTAIKNSNLLLLIDSALTSTDCGEEK